MYRIPLRVINIKLDDDDVVAVIGQYLSELAWLTVAGRVLAVFFDDHEDPVPEAIRAARTIMNRLPGAKVPEVDQDLVNVSDIANRVGVTREAVRSWADGRRGPGEFPDPVAAVSVQSERGHQRIWRWLDVRPWLARHYGYQEEYAALTPEQIVNLNRALLGVKDYFDLGWQFSWEIPSSQPSSSVGQPIKRSLPKHLLDGIIERRASEREGTDELMMLDEPAERKKVIDSPHREGFYGR